MKHALLIAAMAIALAGCVEELPALTGTTSLRVDLISPSETGTANARLPAVAKEVTIQVSALDTTGQIDTSFNKEVDVYASFFGGLTPPPGSPKIKLEAGTSAPATIPLPLVYGPTLLWIEDTRSPDATYATGTSPTLWFHDPTLSDISTPEDEDDSDAMYHSPLEEKEVVITSSRHGSRGRLVVTGVYSQGYTLSDVECRDEAGTPPCTTSDYDHLMVFTYSVPIDKKGRLIKVGHTVARVGGVVQEFNGLTELGFPETRLTDDDPQPALVPASIEITQDWFGENEIRFERAEGGLVRIKNGTVCATDRDYDRYKQWKLDIGAGCERPINVVTTGVADFDPVENDGATLAEIVGTLRPVNTARINVWIVYPRSNADLQLSAP